MAANYTVKECVEAACHTWAFLSFSCHFFCSTDPECWEENEFSRSTETSTCLYCCPSPTVLRPHWATICLPVLPPSPLPPVVAIPEGTKGESAPVNMPGWRSRWRLILLNSLTCGLEICVAAGITYVPPLLLEAGVEERYMTMVLGKCLSNNQASLTSNTNGKLLH